MAATGTELGTSRLAGRSRLASQIGLVLAGVMGAANLSNGAMSLVDPRAGQLDPTVAPQPVWISVTLLVLGLVHGHRNLLVGGQLISLLAVT